MHSRIFMITNEKEEIENLKDIDVTIEAAEYMGADGVEKINDIEEFKNSTGWFSQYYNTPVTIHKKGDFFYTEVDAKAFYEKLKEIKRRRIQEIKKLLEAPEPDLYWIAQRAYYDRGFYFFIDGYSLMPEVEDTLINFTREAAEKNKPLYIIAIFDYHY